jgi:hypothetical protein
LSGRLIRVSNQQAQQPPAPLLQGPSTPVKPAAGLFGLLYKAHAAAAEQAGGEETSARLQALKVKALKKDESLLLAYEGLVSGGYAGEKLVDGLLEAGEIFEYYE